MSRAFLIVMDSAGCGGAPDAAEFGDAGANTLDHIAQACARGDAQEGRSGPLKMPHLAGLGLGRAIMLSSGVPAPGLDADPQGIWGVATQHSPGKDTPTGHWELAGVPLRWDWHYFPTSGPAFSQEITQEVARLSGAEGILGNCHASGTEIIARLGEEHIRTGWPICYTSADSVFQIAAHEEAFGLDRLIRLCRDIAPLLHSRRVGRVIARPFVGSSATDFERTKNRRDFVAAPPEPTLCDWVYDAGQPVHAIGKVGDIFSHRGITSLQKGTDAELMDHLEALTRTAEDGSLCFANFVEFDARFGHRRDVSGYARALEWFDAQLPRLFAGLQPGDLMVFTADHGNDPTWRGTDHTRERVPVIGAGLGPKAIGIVDFVDIAASIADHLGVPSHGPGRSFL
ncbi:MAG: phosphopentomutase [Paracoccaceae bacterium]